MICRHGPRDPDCSSNGGGCYSRSSASIPPSPKVDDFEILDIFRHGALMALKVRYPSCKSCHYEGTKILVVPAAGEVTIHQWKKIDPHFRDPAKTARNACPSPVARFPGSKEGWENAKKFINMVWKR